MSNVPVVRIIASTAALGALLACGSSTQPLAIDQLDPATIGERMPDFILTIRGAGFTPESRIVLGGVELGPLGHNSAALFVQVPGGTAGTTVAGAVAVSVKNPDGSRSNELSLAVSGAPAPVLQYVISNCDSDHVTLIGDNFTFDTIVEVGGEPRPIFERSRSALSFATGWTYGQYQVTVPPPGGGVATIGGADFLDCGG